LPMFLPWEHVRNNFIPATITMSVALAVLYCVSFAILNSLCGDGLKEKQHKIRSWSYILTNFCANTTLAIVGLSYFIQAPPIWDTNVEERVTGFQSCYLLASMQMGYQLWALPVGYFTVNETKLMLVHHVSAIFVSLLSGVFTNGFRYHSPFFFGVYELSSVPLSVMNFFKHNREYANKYPLVNTYSRLSFAVSFMFIRVIMMIPRKLDFLYLLYLWTSTTTWMHWIFLSYCGLATLFLMLIQLYWGSLIVRGGMKLRKKKLTK